MTLAAYAMVPPEPGGSSDPVVTTQGGIDVTSWQTLAVALVAVALGVVAGLALERARHHVGRPRVTVA